MEPTERKWLIRQQNELTGPSLLRRLVAGLGGLLILEWSARLLFWLQCRNENPEDACLVPGCPCSTDWPSRRLGAPRAHVANRPALPSKGRTAVTLRLLVLGLMVSGCSAGIREVTAPDWRATPPTARQTLMVDEAADVGLVAYTESGLYGTEGDACLAITDSQGWHGVFCGTPTRRFRPTVFEFDGAHRYLLVLGGPDWRSVTVGSVTEEFAHGVAVLLDVDLEDELQLEIETESGSRSCRREHLFYLRC